jgi:copper transport protein
MLFLACLGGWLAIALAGAAPASAHVQIVSFSPGDGARLTTAPTQITVRLSENIGIQPGSLRVTDARGTHVDDGPVFQPGDDAEVLAVRLRPGLGDGGYVVSYGFISADSHPVRGAFAFVVGDGPLLSASGAVSASNGTDTTVDALFTAFRWASFCGAVLLGGLVFVLYCRPGGRADPRVRGILAAGCVISAVSAVAAILLQGPYAAGRGLSGVFTASLLDNTLSLSYGKLLILRLAAVAGLGVVGTRLLSPAERLPDRLRFRYENLAMVAGFLILLSFSASGHAVTDDVPFFTITADVAHLGAIAIWLGGVVQVALCLYGPLDRREPETGLRLALARFSPIAAIAVGVVAVSGAYLSLRTVPSLSALWSTRYGVLLSLKLAGFAALLAIANVSRLAVRRSVDPPTQGGGTSTATTSTRALRRAVGAEVLIASVVLLLAAMLSSTAPGGS